MKNKNLKKTILFGVLILILMLIGRPTAFGYLHPADPLVLLAALMLPAPYAMLAAGIAGAAADLLKGYYLLAPLTLILRILMVLLVKKLSSLSPAKKHEELLAAPAAFLPVVLYFLGELIFGLLAGAKEAAWASALGTLNKNLIQAAASVLLFIFIYDMVKGFSAARAQMKAEKKSSERSESDE